MGGLEGNESPLEQCLSELESTLTVVLHSPLRRLGGVLRSYDTHMERYRRRAAALEHRG